MSSAASKPQPRGSHRLFSTSNAIKPQATPKRKTKPPAFTAAAIAARLGGFISSSNQPAGKAQRPFHLFPWRARVWLPDVASKQPIRTSRRSLGTARGSAPSALSSQQRPVTGRTHGFLETLSARHVVPVAPLLSDAGKDPILPGPNDAPARNASMESVVAIALKEQHN